MRPPRSPLLLVCGLFLCLALPRQGSAQGLVSADSLGYAVSFGPTLRIARPTLTVLLPAEFLVLPTGARTWIDERPGGIRGIRLVMTPGLATRLHEADSLAASFKYTLLIASSSFAWIQDGRFNAMYKNGHADVRIGYLLFGPGGQPVTLNGLLPVRELGQALAQYDRVYTTRHMSGS